MTRPTKDEYYVAITDAVAQRSTCVRHKVGAIAVRDNQILATGYNGAPSGLKDCLELGCLRNEQNIPSGTRTEICRAVHAEQNVIIHAATHGVSLTGATIYCTHSPCRLCAKMLVNAKIARWVSWGTYVDPVFGDLFFQAGIEFEAKGDKYIHEVNRNGTN